MNRFITASLVALILALAACALPGQQAPESAPSASTRLPPPTVQAAQPQDTPSGEEPPESGSALPFRDDFTGEIAPAWEWVNESPDRWRITDDGWLEITADNPSVIGGGAAIEQVNLLVLPVPDGDFVATTRVQAEPIESFEQAALSLIQDGENYVAVLTGFCATCAGTISGHGFFMEAFLPALGLGDATILPREASATDVYLRLSYTAATRTVVGLYAVQPDQWQTVRTVSDVPAFKWISLGVSNVPGPDGNTVDLVARFDYFEIAQP